MATKTRRPEVLEKDEEHALAVAWLERGDLRARDRLVTAYAPLASSAAIKVARQSGVHLFEDLQQEANRVLVEILDKFDPSLGHRFGTFARWHIHSHLHRYVMDNVGPTRVATNATDKKIFQSFRKLRAKIEARTGRPLDEEGRQEIASELEVDIQAIYRMEPRVVRTDVSVDQLVRADDDESAGHGYQLVDTGPSPEAQVAVAHDRGNVREVLAEAIAELAPREMRVIHARFLLSKPVSLQQLADEFHMSRKGVQSIENRAMNSLQQALRAAGVTAEEALAYA
jgi:RNA polymerase sigma-32 factor